MKIGFVSRIGEFPEKEWEEEFKIAGERGISHLEIIINYPFLGPKTYAREQIEKIKKLALENKLNLILHLLPNQYQLPEGVRYTDSPEKFQRHEEFLKDKIFNIASVDEKVRKFSIEEIKRTVNIAEKLRAPLIIIHGGNFSKDNNYKNALKIARKSLEELNSYLGKIKLAIENLPTLGHFGNIPYELPIYSKDLLYLTKNLDSVGICFDIGHANTLGDAIEFYESIKKGRKIWDMHLHDNKGDKDEHLQLGRGNINFKKFFEQLKKDNYSGFISIELDTWNETPEQMKNRERVEGFKYLVRLRG